MLFGSIIAANASLPIFVNDHTHPSRVELQAGRFNVMSADANVPIYTRRSVSARVAVAVTVLNACSSTPFMDTAACVDVAVPTTPALAVTRPLNVFAPAHVCEPVPTVPRFVASASGRFRFIVEPERAKPIAAAVVVIPSE